MSLALQASLYRYAVIVIAVVVGVVIWVYVPDPTIKVAAEALILGALGALEQFVKTSALVAATTPTQAPVPGTPATQSH